MACLKCYSLILVAASNFSVAFFLLQPAKEFRSQELICLLGVLFGAHSLRIFHSEGSNRLGVSWLKMAAQSACGTKNLCFKAPVRRWKSPREGDFVNVLFTIFEASCVEVLQAVCR